MSAEYEQASFIIRSEYRHETLNALKGGPKTPTNIARQTIGADRLAHVSRALQELKDEGLVELLVPEETNKGRIYGITDDGEDVLAMANTVNGGVGQ